MWTLYQYGIVDTITVALIRLDTDSFKTSITLETLAIPSLFMLSAMNKKSPSLNLSVKEKTFLTMCDNLALGCQKAKELYYF